jgi:hypothetical protein
MHGGNSVKMYDGVHFDENDIEFVELLYAAALLF